MIIFISVLVGIISLVAFYMKWKFSYWPRRNVATIRPNLLFGNFQNPFNATLSFGDQIKVLYLKFKKMGTTHNGLYLFLQPRYLVTNLENVKNVMTKDFVYFTDRFPYVNEKIDPLSGHLFSIGGLKWRNIRTKLTPTFTSGKIKVMFDTMAECGKLLEKTMQRIPKEQIDIKDVLGRFTTDIIGSCAFGLECNTVSEKESLFRKYGRAMFTPSSFKHFQQMLAFSLPSVGKFFQIKLVPKDASDFFLKVVKDTVNYREENEINRNDFLQLLINVKNNSDSDKLDGSSLTLNEIAAQCFIFFVAGFETSSTTMTFALYELSKNQNLQDKVREEITNVLDQYEGDISYDSLSKMKYMEQVIDETLRMYPPVPLVSRVCVKDYKFSDGSDVVIEKGVTVIIPILGIHHDEEYYPEHTKFDPDRFTEENKKTRHQYAHIPFGEGPRICIGAKFGIMQTKIGLVHLLKNYRFKINSKTKEPLKMSTKSFVLAADGEVWLDAHEL